MATIIRMPEVLANATEAVISTWEATEGAVVAVGDLLAEIETEKAVVEMPAEEAGVLAKHLVPAGATVEVGAPVAVLLTSADEPYDLAALLGEDAPMQSGGAGAVPDAASAVAEGAGTDLSGGSRRDGSSARIFSSPLARKLAKDAGVPLDVLHGTGPGGRIVRRDVEAHLASGPVDRPAPAPAGDPVVVSGRTAQPRDTDAAAYEVVPHSGMRRAIARRLTESKTTVPHFYVVAECRMDALLALRAQINDSGTVKVSVNDFVLKAVAAAFRAVPEANVMWTEEGLRHFVGVDVAVAVATDGGLVTPVVRGVERRTLSEVSAVVADLAARARSGRLRQDELDGGSTTVSNLGMFGTREFSAIINPPQATILAVGAALPAAVVVDGRVEAASVMRCTLSADHRAVDGALAAQWLEAFRKAIESPVLLLV